MSDPFHSPETPIAAPAGSIDIGEALLTGLYGLGRNAIAWVATMVALFIAYIVSICTCIGWVFMLPPMMWAFYKMVLETVRGDTELGSLTSGFENFPIVLGRIWGWMIINLILVLPFGVVLSAGLFAWYGLEGLLVATQDPAFALMTTPFSMLFSLFAIAIFARIQMVPFLLVDRDLGVIEAYAESWRMTEGNWLRLIAIMYFVTLWTLPATTIQMGMQYYVMGLSPAEQLGMVLPQMGVSIVTSTWSVTLGLLNMCAVAAAYDQLSGRADDPSDDES